MNGRNCSQFSRAWYPIVQVPNIRQYRPFFWWVHPNQQPISKIGAVFPSMTGCSCYAIAAISNPTVIAGNVFQFPAGWTYYYTSRTTSSDARSLINSRKMTDNCSVESIRCWRNTVSKLRARKRIALVGNTLPAYLKRAIREPFLPRFHVWIDAPVQCTGSHWNSVKRSEICGNNGRFLPLFRQVGNKDLKMESFAIC